MTIDEIFQKICEHQIKGIMTHAQLADYYDFLDLHGYKRMHEYHMLDEICCMRSMHRYYLNHYNKLIPDTEISSPDIIPAAWFARTRFDVDTSTRKKAVYTGFEKWQAWEIETKKLYEQMYKEACDLGEIAAAMKIKELVCDVDTELKYVERSLIEIKAVDYDMTYVCEQQHWLHDKYKEKEKNIGVDIC